jgi:hypothetical protein
VTELASDEEAEEALAPHYPDIVASVRTGWRDWREMPPEKALKMGKRTRASIVHDGMLAECRTRLDGRQGVTISEKRSRFVVNFDDKILLQFKMFQNMKLRTSGIPTVQRMQFMFQQLSLPGVPSPTGVFAGYVLDSLEQDVALIALTRPRGPFQNKWTIILDDGSAPAGTVSALAMPSGLFRTVQVRSAIVRDDEEKEA